MTPARRPTTPVFAALGLLVVGLGLAAIHVAVRAPGERARLAESTRLVKVLGLTDLALFTEARYTRHPSMADLHTAFQDNPMSFEHFPSGLFIAPPAHLPGGQIGQSEKDFSQ